MPAVNLPDTLVKQLNRSESGTIDDTGGPGVARYWASDRSVRADVYIGLKLDGFKRYRNISSTTPNFKMQFALPPIVSCKSDDIEFNPDHSKVISIKVSSCSSYSFRS